MRDPQAFIDTSIATAKEALDGPTIIAFSGGIDSTVAAQIVSAAIGEQLHCVFVDTGLVRKGEPEQVSRIMEVLGLNGKVVDASERFFSVLEGISDPEAKRHAIGEAFIRVFEEEAKAISAKYLVQGTIAPDWIESGGGLRDTIKSHHNVGGLPENMDLTLHEPLRDLYKDEVRQVARLLGIPDPERQPFPGPGLAVRILGPITRERAETVREACDIVERVLEQAAVDGRCELPWQYFAALLPVKGVGVHGDVRVYGETVAIRAVQSLDGMTANASPIPIKVLMEISRAVTNKLNDRVTRVVYDITDKPPATIEWE